MFTVCLSVPRHPSKVSHLFYFTLLSVIIAFLDLLTFSFSHVVSHNSYIDTLVIHVIFFLCKLSHVLEESLLLTIVFSIRFCLLPLIHLALSQIINHVSISIHWFFVCVFSYTSVTFALHSIWLSLYVCAAGDVFCPNFLLSSLVGRKFGLVLNPRCLVFVSSGYRKCYSLQFHLVIYLFIFSVSRFLFFLFFWVVHHHFSVY